MDWQAKKLKIAAIKSKETGKRCDQVNKTY